MRIQALVFQFQNIGLLLKSFSFNSHRTQEVYLLIKLAFPVMKTALLAPSSENNKVLELFLYLQRPIFITCKCKSFVRDAYYLKSSDSTRFIQLKKIGFIEKQHFIDCNTKTQFKIQIKQKYLIKWTSDVRVINSLWTNNQFNFKNAKRNHDLNTKNGQKEVKLFRFHHIWCDIILHYARTD